MATTRPRAPSPRPTVFALPSLAMRTCSVVPKTRAETSTFFNVWELWLSNTKQYVPVAFNGILNDWLDTSWSIRTAGGREDGEHDWDLFMPKSSKWTEEATPLGSEIVRLPRSSLFMPEKIVMFFGCSTRLPAWTGNPFWTQTFCTLTTGVVWTAGMDA